MNCPHCGCMFSDWETNATRCPNCGVNFGENVLAANSSANIKSEPSLALTKRFSENPTVNLLLEYEGPFHWGAFPAEYLINGIMVVRARHGDGFPILVEIETGSHTLETNLLQQKKAFTLNCPVPGDYVVHIRFSKWSGFSIEFRTPAGASNASSAISGITDGGHFVTCKTLNTGPVGLVEKYSLAGVSTPTLRPAKVKVQNDTLTVSFQDSSGTFHNAVSVPITQILSVETHKVTQGKQIGMVLLQMLGAGIGIGVIILVSIVFNIGIDKLTRSFEKALSAIGISLTIGVIVAFFVVFLPNLFRLGEALTQLIFRVEQDKSFGVFVDKNEMIEATEILDVAGIKLNKERAQKASM